MCRNTFFITMLCFFALSLSAATLTEKSEIQEHLVSEQFLETLTTSLSHLSDFEITSQKEKHFNEYSFLNKGVKDIQTCNFRSQKHLPGKSKGKTYLRFKLSIAEYESTVSAKAGLDGLLNSADPNIGLSYAWDYVCNVGKRIYWLSAPCLLSDQNWRRLTAKLKKIIQENPGQSNSFECRCALNCKRHWNK